MSWPLEFSSERQRKRSRDQGTAHRRAARKQAMDQLAGRCGTMTVTQAMALTGRARETVLGYAKELGEEFLPEPEASVRRRKSREQSGMQDLLRLARKW